MNVTLNTFAVKQKSVNLMNQINLGFAGNISNTGLEKDKFEKNEISFTSLTQNEKAKLKKELNGKLSPLALHRLDYEPKIPTAFKNGIQNVKISEGADTKSVSDQDEISKIFPNTYGQPVLSFKESKNSGKAKVMKVGLILSGGQAAGGHNVITGIYDALKQANPKSEVYGFLNGPSGLVDGNSIKFTDKFLHKYRNQGGFDMIKSGRTKLEKEEQFEKVLENCKRLGINAITVIGGDDSNTNAAVLAEWFKEKGEDIQVIGCPKTIDGDLKNDQIETSFGFDTATKTYAETIGNIQKDSASAVKYWHFQKVMGRSASHVALEVALQTHPNITLISEEVEKKNMSLDDVVTSMANVIAKRSLEGKNYGMAVIPEGLLEFIPDIKSLISNLNDTMSELEKDSEYVGADDKDKFELVKNKLNKHDSKVFSSFPDKIKSQLLMERDPHGNVQVSQIDTDELLISLVKAKLKKMEKEGLFKGKFSAVHQPSGYDGRSGLPSNFDADYCYSLGYSAAALINSGKTGYIATVKNLNKDASKWEAGGAPLTMMMNMEKRHGKMKPVIQKALVDLDGPVFKELQKNRRDWALNDRYLCPGPIQFDGPDEVAYSIPKTLKLEQEKA